MSSSDTPPPNYDSRVPLVIGVSVWLMCVSTVMVGLRIFTRKFIIDQMGIDDYFAIFALFIILGEGVAICSNTSYGLGKHIWMVMDTFPQFMRCFYVSIVLYTAALLFIKLTFLFQYYRLLAVQNMRKIYIAAIVVVTCWGLSQLLIGIFICRPITGFWDLEGQATGAVKCIPNFPQFYINAAGNIATDIAVFVLPLPVIGHLNLARSQKWLLVGIFSLGFFTVVISIIRIRFLKIYADTTWENVEPQLWSIGELTSGITCACLVTLRPLVSRFFPGLLTRAGKSSRGYRATDDSTSRDKKSTSRDIESMGGMRAGTTVSRDRRDGLYDNDKSSPATNSADDFELLQRESGDHSDHIIGLRSTRDELASGPAQAGWGLSKEHDIGLRPTLRTEITPTQRRMDESRVGQRAIQVQRDVYHTKSP